MFGSRWSAAKVRLSAAVIVALLVLLLAWFGIE
jgi:hypothetical protein